MSKVNFNRSKQNFENVKTCYIDNAEEIGSLCSNLKKKGLSEYGKVYCELLNGIWDEDALGEFRGELYADVFEKHLLLTSNSYLLHKYCACHNPYSEHNKTEDEFDKDDLITGYINYVMNDSENINYAMLFHYYVIAYNELMKKK